MTQHTQPTGLSLATAGADHPTETLTGAAAPASLAAPRLVLLTGSAPATARPLGPADDAAALWARTAGTRAALAASAPSAAHEAIALFARARQAQVTVVTLDVDDRYERAGTPVVHHLHGELFRTRCTGCSALGRDDRSTPDGVPTCPACRQALRPDALLDGEAVPEHLRRAVSALVADADALVVLAPAADPTVADVRAWADEHRTEVLVLDPAGSGDPDDGTGLVERLEALLDNAA